jgi:hypothetical protein
MAHPSWPYAILLGFFVQLTSQWSLNTAISLKNLHHFPRYAVIKVNKIGSQTEKVEDHEERLTKGKKVFQRSVSRGKSSLDRLQKVMAHAGIASRRHAETMILDGR